MESSACPFGSEYQHYWDRLSPLEQRMKIDLEGLYSMAQQSIMDQITPLIPGKTAIDAFSGIGGSAIGLARAGKKVVSIDSNAERIEMAKFNAKLFKVEPLIDFRIGDSLKILPTLGADSIFLDPPWGGPGYSKQSKFLLEHFAPHGKTLLTISLDRAACVVIRLPKNFELTELEQFGRKWRLEENFLSGKLMHYTAFFS
jgi:trimethylguanosine synthase